MAKKLAYLVGDRVECLDEEGQKFYGKIVGRGPYKFDRSRLYDVKREDGEMGIGVRNSWRITENTWFGGRVVRRRPKKTSEARA